MQMKVLIVASAGALRRELAGRASSRGHDVMLLEKRRRRWLGRARRGVAEGDVLDEASLETAVARQEAVICWLTKRPDRKATSYYWEGTANLLRVMQKHGVGRLICVTECGAGDSRGHCGFLYDRIIQPLFRKQVSEDRDRQEELVRGTALKWTIVRPAKLTSGNPGGGYMVLTDLRNFKAKKISRADAAEFIVQQLSSDFYVYRAPLITY